MAEPSPSGSDPGRDPVSVILPTVEWGIACEQLADQLGPDDELLIVCDTSEDPVAELDTPEAIEILEAGQPERCSGKANALAYGMERAANDRFIWTDDDFERRSNWIDRLVEASERHGPASVLPRFIGSRWWRVLEPVFAVSQTFAMHTGFGTWGGNVWGGGTTFTRYDVDIETLIADLRRTLSDDGLLSKRLDDVYVVRSLPADVDIPGDFRSVKHRTVRTARLAHVHEGLHSEFLASLALVGLSIASPLPVFMVSTVLLALVYLYVGFRSWSFLLAYPVLFVLPILFGSGIFLNEFEWAGRRYRLNGALNVEVLEQSSN